MSEMSKKSLSALVSSLYDDLGLSTPQKPPTLLADVENLVEEPDRKLSDVLQMLHEKAADRLVPETTEEEFYRDVPLPSGLTLGDLKNALDFTQELMAMLNYEISSHTGVPLSKLIQRNNFSGIVSNLLAVAMERRTDYVRNSDQEHPDLKHRDDGLGLEIKASVKPGKGGEGHNGLGGWHLIACYELDEESGLIRFSNIEVAELISHHQENDGDWKYMGSSVSDSGTQRTETYSTTARGTWKLRHGSAYLDPVVWSNWENLKRQMWRGGPVPDWSPWAQFRKTK